MRYELLSDEEHAEMQRNPFNPPAFTEQFTEADFDKEWWSMQEALSTHLSQRARPYLNTEDWGDFSVSQSRGESRWVWVTFHTSKLWKKDFCEFVAGFLGSFEQGYCVGCTTEPQGFLGLLRLPFIYLAVTKDAAKGQAHKMKFFPKMGMRRNDRYLRKLGFPT